MRHIPPLVWLLATGCSYEQLELPAYPGEPCAAASDCPSDIADCVAEHCVPVAEPSCRSDAECATAELCRVGDCIAGECSYENREVEAPCADGRACTQPDWCDGAGVCVGSPACWSPPPNECQAGDSLFISYDQIGYCDAAGECAYGSRQFKCPDCSRNCLSPCDDVVCDDTRGGCSRAGACAPGDPPTCVYDVAPDGDPCWLQQSGAGLCYGGACVECLADGNCPSDHYCDTAAHLCTPKRDTGIPCSDLGAAACLSGHCADGVCCDQPCLGGCQSCGLSASVGTCTARTDASECTDVCSGCDGSSADCAPVSADEGVGCTGDTSFCCQGTCVTPGGDLGGGCGAGLCTGQWECNATAARCSSQGAPCPGCEADTVLDGSCDQQGSCQIVATATCQACMRCEPGGCQPYPLGAQDSIGLHRCEAQGELCDGSGNCVVSALKPLGQSCNTAAECQSGHCVDGLCCNDACGGACEACNLPGSPGYCMQRQAGDFTECTIPCTACANTPGDCVAHTGSEGPSCTGGSSYCCQGFCVQAGGEYGTSCGYSAECAGIWGCGVGVSRCSSEGNFCGDRCLVPDFMAPHSCDAQGLCTQAGPASECPTCYGCQQYADGPRCEPYLLSVDASGTNRCDSPGYCSSGTCVAAVGGGRGAPCGGTSLCQPGLTCGPEGVCCDRPCAGVCESCTLPGSEGTCTLMGAGTMVSGCGGGTCGYCYTDGTCAAPTDWACPCDSNGCGGCTESECQACCTCGDACLQTR